MIFDEGHHLPAVALDQFASAMDMIIETVESLTARATTKDANRPWQETVTARGPFRLRYWSVCLSPPWVCWAQAANAKVATYASKKHRGSPLSE